MPHQFKIRMYAVHNGSRFEVTLPWRGEADYLLGKDFLENHLGVTPFPTASPREIEYYYLNVEGQYDALMEFRRKLVEKFGPIPQSED